MEGFSGVTCHCGRKAFFENAKSDVREVEATAGQQISADSWTCGVCGTGRLMPVICEYAVR